MKVTAYDRPGLLSEIGSAMTSCGVTLHKAKVATYGEKAEDIFFVSDENGNPISKKEKMACLEKMITRNLDLNS